MGHFGFYFSNKMARQHILVFSISKNVIKQIATIFVE